LGVFITTKINGSNKDIYLSAKEQKSKRAKKLVERLRQEKAPGRERPPQEKLSGREKHSARKGPGQRNFPTGIGPPGEVYRKGSFPAGKRPMQ